MIQSTRTAVSRCTDRNDAHAAYRQWTRGRHYVPRPESLAGSCNDAEQASGAVVNNAKHRGTNLLLRWLRSGLARYRAQR